LRRSRCTLQPEDLLSLKENSIIGRLIPAGSGIYRYAEIDIQPPATLVGDEE
jgi:hypothetical protein